MFGGWPPPLAASPKAAAGSASPPVTSLPPPPGPDICGPGTKKVHVIFNYKGKNVLINKDIRCKVRGGAQPLLAVLWG